jgi:hypothetical protein
MAIKVVGFREGCEKVKLRVLQLHPLLSTLWFRHLSTSNQTTLTPMNRLHPISNSIGYNRYYFIPPHPSDHALPRISQPPPAVVGGTASAS